MRPRLGSLLQLILLLALASVASATTWYVNGATGSDSNNCLSASTACKTIGHAILLAAAGETIQVAAATYTENLTINISLSLIGSGASGTIIDGGGINTVVTISSATAHVAISKITVRHGYTHQHAGGGIDNIGTMTVNNSAITGNTTCFGGGISNGGTMTINSSAVSGNSVNQLGICRGFGGGIANSGTLTLNNSTISGNTASGTFGPTGGGIYNKGALTVNNSTISGNMLAKSGTSAGTDGGGIANSGTLKISSSTISANGAQFGGNLYGTTRMQNSIVANPLSGGNCHGTVVSEGYNLSSDGTCGLSGPGDMNNTAAQLGPLQNNGGPTQTMALPLASPAVDAGNPTGCTDGLGHLLKTDQRGKPRPDAGETAGCDIGAYEYQEALAHGHCVWVCPSTRCGELTGYCVGSVNNSCRSTYDPRQCPVGQPTRGSGSSCGESIDPTRTCTP